MWIKSCRKEQGKKEKLLFNTSEIIKAIQEIEQTVAKSRGLQKYILEKGNIFIYSVKYIKTV